MARLSARLALLALAASILISPALAQSYPTRQVSVICSLGAGTGVDITTRVYSERLAKHFGQPFVVENRPGSAGMIAVDAVKKAAPDGYTLGVYTSASMAIRPTMLKRPTYDPLRDFVPVAQYLKSAFVLVVNPDLPIHSIADLVGYVKAQPGKVSYAISGIGGAPHLTGEFLAMHFGMALAPAPYKQSPQAFQDVAAGHIPLSIADAGTALPLITIGRLRALAVTSAFRLPTLPEVQTLAEALQIKDLELVSWHVLSAPSSTPRPVVDSLHRQMQAIMADPEVVKRVASLGLLPHAVPSIEATQAYIQAEIDKWGGLIRKLGLAKSV